MKRSPGVGIELLIGEVPAKRNRDSEYDGVSEKAPLHLATFRDAESVSSRSAIYPRVDNATRKRETAQPPLANHAHHGPSSGG